MMPCSMRGIQPARQALAAGLRTASKGSGPCLQKSESGSPVDEFHRQVVPPDAGSSEKT